MTVNIYDMADTWNNGATVFNGIKLNVTDTASDAASLLMDLQVGGVSKARINKSGHLFASQIRFTNAVQGTKGQIEHNGGTGNGGQISFWPVTNSTIPMMSCTNYITTVSSLGLTNAASTGTIYAYLYAVAGVHGTLEQRFGTTAQTFNIYNTWTNSSNYERGFVRFSAGVFEIGTANAGTGGIKALHLIPTGELRFGGNGGNTFRCSNTTLFPAIDSSYDLGTTANRMRRIYTDAIQADALELTSIPASDPGVSGRIWNDAGTLKVSA